MVALLFASPALVAAQPARAEQARIDALLKSIEDSGCRFERNGAQYAAAEGAAHLRMKLEKAGARVQTAAQFIERVAAGSSQSGRPYRVVCPDRPVQTSRQWLDQRLAELAGAGR